MRPPAVRIFVQARMSSRRFPGKMLAPLAGRPLVDHVLERCARAFGKDKVVLATSTDETDDVLAAHAASGGYAVFRGDLHNVLGRFQACLEHHPCDWFVRISADSPLIDPALVVRIAERREERYDLVTNIQARTFPAGQSVEVVRSACFAALDAAAVSAAEREHVTPAFYREPGRYRIRNVACRTPQLGRESLAVDTPEDLMRMEALMARGAMPDFAALCEDAT